MDASSYQKIGVELANSRLKGEDELRLTLISNSMAPFLRPGDAVFIRGGSHFRVGEILSVRHGDHLITHRLVRVEGPRLTLKGDNLRRLDRPAPAASVLGRLSGLDRDGRRIPWEPGFWDRMIAALSRAEGQIFESFGVSKSKPLSKSRRLFLQLATRPLRIIFSFISRRLAIKYGAEISGPIGAANTPAEGGQ